MITNISVVKQKYRSVYCNCSLGKVYTHIYDDTHTPRMHTTISTTFTSSQYVYSLVQARSMHTTCVWPRNWPLRRLRPCSPFPTKGATKSASQTPQSARGVGRLSRVDRRFFRARNPAGGGHCRWFFVHVTALTYPDTWSRAAMRNADGDRPTPTPTPTPRCEALNPFKNHDKCLFLDYLPPSSSPTPVLFVILNVPRVRPRANSTSYLAVTSTAFPA